MLDTPVDVNTEPQEDEPTQTKIRILSYKKFKELTEFPRFPECENLVESINEVDHENTLFIFISHCWIAGWSGASHWRGYPHPDNKNNDKFKLTIKAIELAHCILAPQMENCYIWLDYGCINQDEDPAGELKQLNKIIELSDCILTPIFDEEWDQWEIKENHRGMFHCYEAKDWKIGPHAYLNRAWCRMEQFYAANIPLRKDNSTRILKFKAGLKFAAQYGHRPHLLYGSRESNNNTCFKILEPLQNNLLDSFHPLKGAITKETDLIKIKSLLEELMPYMKTVTYGYDGELDEKNRPHGKGRHLYEDGHEYVGEWKNGKHHGKGKLTFTNGSVYEGSFEFYKRHGFGEMYWAGGSVFRGDYVRGKATQGTLSRPVYCNSDSNAYSKSSTRSAMNLYTGTFLNDFKYGKGVMTYSDGRIEDGYWENDIFVGNENIIDCPAPSSPEVRFQKKKICMNWQRDGTCSFGDTCWFAHDDSSVCSSPISP